LAIKFRDFLVNRSLDILQPNVAITGGFTQCMKIAGMAEAFNVAIDNGGAWPFHNMHLHAGVRNGGMVEYHVFSVECLSQVYNDLPVPHDGMIDLPETPGLGFSLNKEALVELSKSATSLGRGK
jgi:L-alanine-DL-glutamate epimerase-like enolase superfamily enzyme